LFLISLLMPKIELCAAVPILCRITTAFGIQSHFVSFHPLFFFLSILPGP
jgi:hypothetical protein